MRELIRELNQEKSHGLCAYFNSFIIAIVTGNHCKVYSNIYCIDVYISMYIVQESLEFRQSPCSSLLIPEVTAYRLYF